MCRERLSSTSRASTTFLTMEDMPLLLFCRRKLSWARGPFKRSRFGSEDRSGSPDRGARRGGKTDSGGPQGPDEARSAAPALPSHGFGRRMRNSRPRPLRPVLPRLLRAVHRGVGGAEELVLLLLDRSAGSGVLADGGDPERRRQISQRKRPLVEPVRARQVDRAADRVANRFGDVESLR